MAIAFVILVESVVLVVECTIVCLLFSRACGQHFHLLRTYSLSHLFCRDSFLNPYSLPVDGEGLRVGAHGNESGRGRLAGGSANLGLGVNAVGLLGRH